MRQSILAFLILPAITLQTACIREEALNAECDIVAVQISQDILSRSPIISNNEVTIIVKDGIDLDGLAPVFTLTPGATISPESGTPRDFNTPQQYTVTSEDKEWSKTYTVDIQHTNAVVLNYDFDHVRQVPTQSGEGSYDVFYEVGADGQVQTRHSHSPTPKGLRIHSPPINLTTVKPGNAWPSPHVLLGHSALW